VVRVFDAHSSHWQQKLIRISYDASEDIRLTNEKHFSNKLFCVNNSDKSGLLGTSRKKIRKGSLEQEL
jgi:hypothetical protein